MNLMIQLHRMAEILFLLTGAAIIVAFVILKNSEAYAFYAETFLKLIDLPMILFAVIFAVTSLRLSLTYQHFDTKELATEEYLAMPKTDIALLIVAVTIILTVVTIDLIFPEQFHLSLLLN